VILEKIGTLLKKNTKTKLWWMKLGIAIILSNIFFFVLVGTDDEIKPSEFKIPEGWVEIQLNAELMTPFHSGKRILIIHRAGKKKLEGVLQLSGVDQLGKITVLVRESEAHTLFQHESWEVLPYLKHLNFVSVKKDASHEIRY
jgi:hypothetical protein